MTTRFSLLTLGTACIASIGVAQLPYRVTQFKELTRYQLSDPLQRTASLAVGDVNGDACLDLLIGNVGADSCLLVNNGKGQFLDQTGKRLPPAPESGRACPPHRAGRRHRQARRKRGRPRRVRSWRHLVEACTRPLEYHR